MTLNYMRQLQPVALIDPRIDYDTDDTSTVGSDDNQSGIGDKYLVYRGPKNIEYYEIPSVSGEGGNASGSTDFNIFMPSRETILDRCIFLRADIEVDIRATAVGAVTYNYLQNGRFGLTAFPLHHCINVLTLQIDGVSYTVDLQNSFKHLKYYSYTEDELKTYSSTAPVLLDNSSVFTPANPYNVLASGSQKTLNAILPRGAFQQNSLSQYKGVKAETATTTKPGSVAQAAFSNVKYTVTEPIYLSPLIVNAIQQSRSTGITGMANIRVKITWKSVQESFYYGFNVSIYPMAPTTAIDASTTNVTSNTTGALIEYYSESTPATGTTVVTGPIYYGSGVPTADIDLSGTTKTLTITKPTFLIGMLTLPDTHVSPSINSYSFMKYETHTENSTQTTGTSDTFTITSRNYNLAQIPHYILMAVTPTINGTVYSQYMKATGTIPINALPEKYYGIQNVNITILAFN